MGLVLPAIDRSGSRYDIDARGETIIDQAPCQFVGSDRGVRYQDQLQEGPFCIDSPAPGDRMWAVWVVKIVSCRVGGGDWSRFDEEFHQRLQQIGVEGSIRAMNWLEEIGDERTRHRIPESGDFIIGRAPTSSLRIAEPGVSRSHASIRHHEGAVWIRDLNSSNGTWLLVSGQPPRKVIDETSLRAGDRIRIGTVELCFCQPQTELLAGGRWSQVEKIGSGGMGQVLRALDRDLGCTVAVKKILTEEGDRAQLLQRLHAREAAIGRGIDHPNVVRVLDEGIFDGSSVQVMEWVGGGDLSTSIQRLSKNPVEGLEVIRQVALGLVAAHENEVVHADLKPANVLQVEQDSSGKYQAELLESEPDEFTDPAEERERSEAYIKQVESNLEDPPFVSRSGELALIEEVVRSQQRSWVLIFGERGVGRTRLAREAKQQFGDAVHVGEEFTMPPVDFQKVWLTTMPQQWPDERNWIARLDAAREAGILTEIHLRGLLPGPAGRWIEMLLEARSGEGGQFLSHLGIAEGADGHPKRLLQSIEKSLSRKAWRPDEGGATLYPLRLRESSRDEAIRLGAVLEGSTPLLRQLLEKISLFEGSLTERQIAAVIEQDRAILHSLVTEALDLELLIKDTDGTVSPVSEGLAKALAGRVPKSLRKELIGAAADLIEDSPPAHRRNPGQWVKRGRLLRLGSRYQPAIEAFLIAALSARSRYDRASFIESLDEARSTVREAATAGERRAIEEAEKEILGGVPRGLVAIERLRKLPIDVCAKIADFGIARYSGETSTPDGLPWGTPRYMSPEQARKQSLTPASDVYSLGLMAREITEGKHPLGSSRSADAIRKISRGDLDELDSNDLGSRWEQMLAKMLSLDPGLRPTATEVAEQIAAIQVRD